MFKETLSKIFNVDSLISNLQGYVETRVELLKIEAKEEMAKGLSHAVVYLVLAFVFALFLVFFSIALAVLAGSYWGSFAGFLLVGGLYLVAGLILWFSREKVQVSVEKRFAHIFRKKKE